MNKSRTIILSVFIVLALWAGLSVAFNYYDLKIQQNRLDTLAELVAVSVWNLEPAAPRAYLTLACRNRGYRELIISLDNGEPFLAINQSPADLLLNRLVGMGIVDPVPITSAITYRGENLGSMRVVWYPESIYKILYSLGIVLLLLVAEWFYLGNVEAKRRLEERVRRRTNDLQLANADLKITIGEQHETEKALRKSEDDYRELFNSITDFLFTHDMDGRILTINQSAADSLGFAIDEMVGQSISDFMLPEYQAGFHTEYLPAIKAHGKLEGLAIYLSKDGRKHHIEYINVVVTLDGRQAYVSGSGREVTERIMAQRQLKKLRKQLTQSQKLEAVGTLAGGVAHDFNNILQAIGGFAHNLAKADIDQTFRGQAERIIESVDRAANLVRSLLTFSRKVDPELTALDINGEIMKALTILERTLPRMVRIEADLSPDLHPINADAGQIMQVLINLGSNAGDAMADGGVLTFATGNVELEYGVRDNPYNLEDGSYVELKVSDTGHGMDDETMAKVFEPFFTTKEVGQGTGLGLATVYGIVQGHGGSIDITSRVGEGTVFTIMLPARPDISLPPDRQPEIVSQPAGGQETILVVDDEQGILDTAQTSLCELGYEVVTAGSGEEAFEIFSEKGRSIDLVILDLSMPGMGGRKCMAKILDLDPRAKIIIASGYWPEEALSEQEQMSPAEFIPKPYRLNKLAMVVRKVLDGESTR